MPSPPVLALYQLPDGLRWRASEERTPVEKPRKIFFEAPDLIEDRS
jgi:hypothetical protein